MRIFPALLICILIQSCAFTKHAPDEGKLLSSNDCLHLSGKYEVNPNSFKSLQGLKFWDLTKYITLDIQLSKQRATFIGHLGNGTKETIHIQKSDLDCNDSILTIYADKHSTNNGGVSVYESRKIQFFTFDQGETVARIVQTSSGLVFLVPTIVTEDGAAILSRYEKTPDN